MIQKNNETRIGSEIDKNILNQCKEVIYKLEI